MDSKFYDNIHSIALTTIVEEKLVDRASILGNFVCPIYVERGKEYAHIASGVLLNIGSEKFIATAAHVLDSCNGGQICLRGEEKLFRFMPLFSMTHHPGADSPNDDKVDLAFAQFDDLSLQLLTKKYTFWNLCHDLVEIDDRPHPQFNFYTFVGYPSSRNKVKMNLMKTYTASYSLTNPEVRTFVYENQHIDRKRHLVIPFKLEELTDRYGRSISFPSPTGMSGGGIWSYRILYVPKLLKLDIIPKFAGITVEKTTDKKHWVGTRAVFLLEAMRAVYPHLSASIPQSKQFGFDIEIEGY